MSRIIDADALKDNMRFRGAMLDDNHLMYVPWADVSKSIDNAPTVDAEIVVRCQNCKHHGSCGYEDIPGWYCADGERREDDGTR